MKCEELLGALGDYIDGRTQSALCQALREHLAGCRPCRIVIDNLRQTITLYRAGEPVALPAGLHDRLYALLRRRWAARHAPRRSVR